MFAIEKVDPSTAPTLALHDECRDPFKLDLFTLMRFSEYWHGACPGHAIEL